MNKQTKIFSDFGLIPGRMISFSKTLYRDKNPNNEVYFNANIFLIGEGKIWYGDLDMTKDEKMLQKIANSVGKSLYILREMDGRFENENLLDEKIISKSVKVINPIV